MTRNKGRSSQPPPSKIPLLSPSAVTGGRRRSLPNDRFSFFRSPLKTLNESTLSDSGGGSSDLGSGAAPTNQFNATPPTSPSRGEVASIGGELDISHFSFSPKTCLDILPSLTEEQLQFEIKYMNITTTASTKRGYVNAIRTILQKNVCNDFSKTIDCVTDTISSFACLVKRAEKTVETLSKLSPPVTAPVDTAPDDPVSVSDLPLPDTPEVDPSVCTVVSDIFNELSVAGILEQISLDTSESHGRKTDYFGQIGYSYGRIKHEPATYPDKPVFARILTGMKEIVPDFSYEDYTCLVTYYPDGKAQIPLHNDDEEQIVEGSTIYTVSVGCDRYLTLQNQVGLINETAINITHGSVYSMTRDSQTMWKHGMLPQDCSAPRISFGFRKLKPQASVPKRSPAPPITRPEDYRSPNSIPTGTHERCLLLTDSILSATPVSTFSRIANVRCIKKSNKRLVDVFNFEPEFGISNTVIISAGVNDMSCYGLTARTLADMVCERLRRTCKKYPKTKFMFNSVLSVHTKHDWLNREIEQFNGFMHELSLTIPNLAFFDSHAILMNDRISDRLGGVIDLEDRRGVHITWQARKLVTDQLVLAVEFTSCLSGGKRPTGRLRNWVWPLRLHFVNR